METVQNTAELLVRCLEAEGVRYIFGIPGEENLAVLEALKDSSIRFVTVRHEQGAAFMADVYGRLTGKAGVCLSTLGPGATNLITGVADADSDGAPLVARAFTPMYTTTQPNGPGCEPICRQARDTLAHAEAEARRIVEQAAVDAEATIARGSYIFS